MIKMTKKDQPMHNDIYTMPRAKPSWSDISSQLKSFRVVVSFSSQDLLENVGKDIRRHFHFDVMYEVPYSSLVQYN